MEGVAVQALLCYQEICCIGIKLLNSGITTLNDQIVSWYKAACAGARRQVHTLVIAGKSKCQIQIHSLRTYFAFKMY